MKQKSFYSLLLVSVMTLTAILSSGCTEEEPEMFTTQRIVINYTDSVVDASISPEAKTRSQSGSSTPAGGVLTSKSGKNLYLSCTETAWPLEKTATTRGTKVTTAGISNLGVSASVYPAASSYASAGCGSYFYKESVSSGTPTRFYWPTADYKISFFGYYPYGLHRTVGCQCYRCADIRLYRAVGHRQSAGYHDRTGHRPARRIVITCQHDAGTPMLCHSF